MYSDFYNIQNCPPIAQWLNLPWTGKNTRRAGTKISLLITSQTVAVLYSEINDCTNTTISKIDNGT